MEESWELMPVLGDGLMATYRILVSCGDRRPKASLYTFSFVFAEAPHCNRFGSVLGWIAGGNDSTLR